jgi:hypothetical protein
MCENCGYSSHIVEPYNHLSLEIPEDAKNPSLQELLESFLIVR